MIKIFIVTTKSEREKEALSKFIFIHGTFMVYYEALGGRESSFFYFASMRIHNSECCYHKMFRILNAHLDKLFYVALPRA